MKNLKFLLIALLALPLGFASCGDDDDSSLPKEPTASLSLTIDMPSTATEVTVPDPDYDESIEQSDYYHMPDLTNIIIVAHRLDDEGFEALFNFKDLEIEGEQKRTITLGELHFPLNSSYYLTIIATVHKGLTNQQLQLLKNNYSEAICQIDNNYTFWKTIEISMLEEEVVSTNKTISYFEQQIELDRASRGFYTFSIRGWEKVPTGDQVNLEFEIKDMPTAFFVKTGKTLSKEEHTVYDIPRYSDKVTVEELQSQSLVLEYVALPNRHLENVPEETGTFSFTFSQNGEEKNKVDMQLGHHSRDVGNSFVYFCDLFSPEVKY